MSDDDPTGDDFPRLPPALAELLAEESQQATPHDWRRLWARLRRSREAERADVDVEAAWKDFEKRHLPPPRAKQKPPGERPPASRETAPPETRAQAPPRPAAVPDRNRTGLVSSVSPWGWTAAAVVLALLTGLLAYWQVPVTVAAAPGRTATTTLPDGTTIELGGGTTLTYQRGFGTWPFVPAGKRRLRLEGEAFFDVPKEARPFVVETFNASIQGQGMALNIDAHQEAPMDETNVTVVSGRVRLAAAGRGGQAVTLAPGQASMVRARARRPAAPRPGHLAYDLAWRNGGFAARDAPLGVVLTKLEEQFGTQITVVEPALYDHSMSMLYARQARLETIMHDLCTSLDLRCRATEQGYTLASR